MDRNNPTYTFHTLFCHREEVIYLKSLLSLLKQKEANLEDNNSKFALFLIHQFNIFLFLIMINKNAFPFLIFFKYGLIFILFFQPSFKDTLEESKTFFTHSRYSLI